jgi:hypothetical protein
MATFNQILKTIQAALDKFHQQIPGLQETMMEGISEQLRRLEVDTSGNLKQTVANIQILSSIKNKLTKIVLNDDYVGEVKTFAKTFNDIANLQNQYWKTVEPAFKAKPLLREIRVQAISSTIDQLTENGIGVNVSASISKMLQANITSGGSMMKLERVLRNRVVGTEEYDGFLDAYTKQVTTDAINQYNAQYTHAVASDLGFEWYAYQGSDIITTRHFCDAMTDFRYFHVSEIPRLLRAEDLYYKNKNGKERLVEIYPRTNLPYGMIGGTNAANFFINRGGYNCGHQIRPVSESLVPQDIKDRVYATAAYKNWKASTGA